MAVLLWEDMSSTQDCIWPHFQRPRSLSKKIPAVGCISNSLGAWKCGQTQAFVFDILLTTNWLHK